MAQRETSQRDLPERERPNEEQRYGKARISRVIGRKPNSSQAPPRQLLLNLRTRAEENCDPFGCWPAREGVSRSLCRNMNCAERFQPSHCEIKTSRLSPLSSSRHPVFLSFLPSFLPCLSLRPRPPLTVEALWGSANERLIGKI